MAVTQEWVAGIYSQSQGLENPSSCFAVSIEGLKNRQRGNIKEKRPVALGVCLELKSKTQSLALRVL